MEAADVLYGVSMGKDGVSKVVSRRLERAAAGEPTEPTRRRATSAAVERRSVERGPAHAAREVASA